MKRVVICLLLLLQNSLWCSEMPAYWDGTYCYPWDAGQEPRGSQILEGKTLIFNAPHLHTYGHALLDGLIPLYAILKERDLLQTSVNLVVEADGWLQKNSAFCKIIQFAKVVFPNLNVIVANPNGHRTVGFRGSSNCLFFKNLIVNEHVPFFGRETPKFSFYKTYPDGYQYIAKLREFGMCDNVVYQDVKNRDNIVREFVARVKKAYSIDLPTKKNRVLLVYRHHSRKILNLDEVEAALKNNGFDVVRADFNTMSIQEQIAATMEAEYMIGTYGSNLTNAIFLNPNAKVVVLWHKYAKYFWSRKYCVIHSAFLSVGVKLIECDKPDYDPRDVYTSDICVPEFFTKIGSMTVLKEDKTSIDQIVQYPRAAMSEILEVDMVIDSDALVELIKKTR